MDSVEMAYVGEDGNEEGVVEEDEVCMTKNEGLKRGWKFIVVSPIDLNLQWCYRDILGVLRPEWSR